MNKKNIFLILLIFFFLFSCGENKKIENLEKNTEKISQNIKKIKKENYQKNKKIEKKQEELEKKFKEKKEKKQIKLLNFSGSLEKKIKGDLEKIIIEKAGKEKKKDLNTIANGVGDDFVEPIIEGKIKEIYEDSEGKIKYKDTKYSYKIDKSNTDFIDFYEIIKNKNTIIFKGKSLVELNKIVVHFDNDKTKFPENFYTLKEFDYGDKYFSYKINYSFKNIDLGLNKYEIMAFAGDIFKTMKLEIKVDNLENLTRPVSKIKIGKYCLLDSCLEEKFGEIEEADNEYIQKLEDGKINYLLKDKSFGLENIGIGKNEKKVFTSKFPLFYIRTYYKNIGNKGQIKQEIFDKYGYKKIKNFYNLVKEKFNFDQNLKFGNYTFSLDFNIENNIGDDILFVDDKQYSSSEEIKKYIDNLIENNKQIYKKYIFLINSEKQIYISYKSNIKKPERIIYLGNDEDWLNENINLNGELLDLEINNKILSYYGIDSDKVIKNSSGNILFEITEKDLPVFKIKKFDNSGNYMLYLTSGYKVD